jgi:general secretion pathway protein E
MAQRLVRRLCPECAQPDEPSPALVDRWQALAARLPAGPLRDGSARWSRAVGCAACQGTGYRGRVGVYELAPISPEMQQQIVGNSDAAALRRLADAAGRRSLVEDGLIKARQGATTYDEVLRGASGTETE